MASMNDLPIELLPFIFKYLGLVDLFRCRLVCKRWRFFCDEQKVTELIIKCDDSGIPADKWYYTEKAIEQDCVIKLDLFGTQYLVFKKQVIRLNLVRNLKRLKVHSFLWITSSSRLTSHLYLFEQLEQLDLQFKLREGWNLSISHSNLRIVSVDTFIDNYNQLDLDTEKLEVLKFTGMFDSVFITHPSSIKHLTTSLYNPFQQSKLATLTNLEYLQGSAIARLDPIILTQLPKLKEWKFVIEVDDFQLIEDFDDYSDVKQTIIDLIQMKQTLQKREPKLYFDGVPLTGVKEFKRILRDQFRQLAGLDDSDESMDEDVNSNDVNPNDENPNDEGMEANGNNNANNGDGDQDVIIID